MYQKVEDWLALLEALTVELPLALQRGLLGANEADREIEEAFSKSHHAWVSLANATVNALYVRTGICDIALESFNAMVRLQRFAHAIAKLVAAGLGPSLGLASASEIEALQEDVLRVRRELKDLTTALKVQLDVGGLRRVK